MSAPSKGIISTVKDSVGGTLDTILSLPDRSQDPAIRKVARIGFDILIIGLGCLVFYIMTKGRLSNLANPGLSSLMVIPLSGAIVGLGGSWLLQDIIGKKYQRTVGKIIAIIMPIALAAGAACLFGAGFHSGIFTTTSMGTWYFVGLLSFPMAFYFADRAIDKSRQKRMHFIHDTSPSIKNHGSAKRKSSEEENDVPTNFYVEEAV